jgi:hypothetical protein
MGMSKRPDTLFTIWLIFPFRKKRLANNWTVNKRKNYIHETSHNTTDAGQRK